MTMGKIFFASICQEKHQEKGNKISISVRKSVKSIRLITVQGFHFTKTHITFSFFFFSFDEHTASVMVGYTNLKPDIFQKQIWHAGWLLYRTFSKFLIPKHWIPNCNSTASSMKYYLTLVLQQCSDYNIKKGRSRWNLFCIHDKFSQQLAKFRKAYSHTN